MPCKLIAPASKKHFKFFKDALMCTARTIQLLCLWFKRLTIAFRVIHALGFESPFLSRLGDSTILPIVIISLSLAYDLRSD